MLEIFNMDEPTLVSVTDLEAVGEPTISLPSARAVADSCSTVARIVVPLPATLIECGLPGALELTTSCAVRAPATVGRNATLKVQLAPTLTGMPTAQDPARTKSPGCAPVSERLAKVSGALPLLESVIDCDALAVLRSCAATKLMVWPERLIAGCGNAPVPLRAITLVPPAAL